MRLIVTIYFSYFLPQENLQKIAAMESQKQPVVVYPTPSNPNQQYADQNQQYDANTYAANNDNSINGDATNEISTYVPAPNEVVGLPPYQYYSEFSPAAYAQSGLNPGAFDVQTGFNGYLVPHLPDTAVVAEEPPSPSGILPNLLGPLLSNTFGSTITEVIPSATRQIGPFIGRTVAYLFGMMGLTVLGGGLTTLICTFTPICTITFALPFVGLRQFGTLAKLNDDTQKSIIEASSEMISGAMKKLDIIKKTDEEKAAAVKQEPLAETLIKKVQKITNAVKSTVEQVAVDAKLIEPKANTDDNQKPIDSNKSAANS